MTWATNWVSSEGKGKLLKVALNDLRGALNGRCLAVYRTVPANCSAIGTGDIILSSWFSAFQSEITTLIGLYVNHTDNGGDWDGETTIPTWTESDIITVIGDSERYDAPTDPLISAGWMYQQYNIINLLRWARGTAGYQSPWQIKESAIGVTPLPWSNVVSAYNSASYQGRNFNLTCFDKQKTSTDGRIESVKIKYTIIRGDDDNSFIPDYDLYQDYKKPDFQTYYNPGGYAIGEYQKIDSGSYLISEYNKSTPYIEYDYDTTEPSVGNFGYIGSGIIPKLGTFLVVKFDGTNGFTYKDW